MTPAMRFRRGRMFAVISSVLFLVAVLADERAVDLVAAETVTQSESVTAARTRLLGEGWDAPDQVRLRWFGVSNFVASFGGHVVLLDGWVIEGATSGYVPITVGDLIAARPEFIYVGHGHFDHMAHVDEIAEATGAKVVTSSENCAIARSDASDPESISCVPVVDRTTGEPFSGGTDVLGPSLGGSTPWGAVGVPAEAPRGLVISDQKQALRAAAPRRGRSASSPRSSAQPERYPEAPAQGAGCSSLLRARRRRSQRHPRLPLHLWRPHAAVARFGSPTRGSPEPPRSRPPCSPSAMWTSRSGPLARGVQSVHERPEGRRRLHRGRNAQGLHPHAP